MKDIIKHLQENSGEKEGALIDSKLIYQVFPINSYLISEDDENQRGGLFAAKILYKFNNAHVSEGTFLIKKESDERFLLYIKSSQKTKTQKFLIKKTNTKFYVSDKLGNPLEKGPSKEFQSIESLVFYLQQNEIKAKGNLSIKLTEPYAGTYDLPSEQLAVSRNSSIHDNGYFSASGSGSNGEYKPDTSVWGNHNEFQYDLDTGHHSVDLGEGSGTSPLARKPSVYEGFGDGGGGGGEPAKIRAARRAARRVAKKTRGDHAYENVPPSVLGQSNDNQYAAAEGSSTYGRPSTLVGQPAAGQSQESFNGFGDGGGGSEA